MEQLQNLIGGELRGAINGEWLDNIEPATGRVYSQIPRSTAADVALAVEAAAKAFPTWSAVAFAERAACLRRWADKIAHHSEALVLAESKDNGKPISLAAEVDIPRAQQNLEFFAGAIEHFASEAHIPADASHIHYTHRKPIGIVGCISPWNLPLYLFTWKIAPAIAAGNCVIAKPSEITPFSAFMLSQWAEESGIPKGVFNVVHGLGNEVGQAIVEHPQIKAISFTGGTATGALIAKTTAPQFKKLSLELGGKNPAIIFADCDFEKALATTIRSSFANQGQICLCSSRILIEDSIYDRFKTALVEKVQRMQVGDPLEKGTKMGAVVSQAHRDKILQTIEKAKEAGGLILCGGSAATPPNERCNFGFFVQPTIIEGLGPDCEINQEEVFGPVITLQRFNGENQAIALANDSQYGLAATIWTQDIGKAHRTAASIESGIAWINCWLVRDLRTPFGGVKASGVGREGGFEALRFFTEPQNVCLPTQSN
jgi:aminomuconate-semialdehyde/2-hydroxymuconate-6-semialdehyde dehydrogenase